MRFKQNLNPKIYNVNIIHLILLTASSYKYMFSSKFTAKYKGIITSKFGEESQMYNVAGNVSKILVTNHQFIFYLSS